MEHLHRPQYDIVEGLQVFGSQFGLHQDVVKHSGHVSRLAGFETRIEHVQALVNLAFDDHLGRHLQFRLGVLLDIGVAEIAGLFPALLRDVLLFRLAAEPLGQSSERLEDVVRPLAAVLGLRMGLVKEVHEEFVALFRPVLRASNWACSSVGMTLLGTIASSRSRYTSALESSPCSIEEAT